MRTNHNASGKPSLEGCVGLRYPLRWVLQATYPWVCGILTFYHQCLGYCKVVATISDKILLRHIYSDSNSKKYSDVITSKTPFEMILDGYKKAGRENFAAEIQKDELIYILDELKKIPEYDTKEIRKKVFESLTEIDFDSSLFSTEEEKKMIKQYKKIKAGKWWYVSDIRAAIRR